MCVCVCGLILPLIQRTAAETYREAVKIRFSGKLESWQSDEVIDLCEKVIVKMEAGIERAIKLNDGVTPTYWIFEVTDYEVLDDVDSLSRHYIRAKEFKPSKVVAESCIFLLLSTVARSSHFSLPTRTVLFSRRYRSSWKARRVK